MDSSAVMFHGIVKGGVVVPSEPTGLPEGAQVKILLPIPEIPPDMQEEFASWERASDEAWAMIDRWEKESWAVHSV